MKASERDPNWRSKCYAQRFKAIAERIDEKWERDPVSGCKIWIGARDKDGYAFIRMNGANIRVSRYLLGQKLGRELGDNEIACHSCDNPPCINEDHLWLGDSTANQIDCARKSRCRGQILSITDVREIRRRWIAGARQVDLSRQYGVSDTTICHVVHQKKWKHVYYSPDEIAAYEAARQRHQSRRVA